MHRRLGLWGEVLVGYERRQDMPASVPRPNRRDKHGDRPDREQKNQK